jgi:hypothetical protein
MRSAAPAELAFASTAGHAATFGDIRFWERTCMRLCGLTRYLPWFLANADLSTEDQEAVASQLGGLMRRVYELTRPADAVWSNDLLGYLRALLVAQK